MRQREGEENEQKKEKFVLEKRLLEGIMSGGVLGRRKC